MRGRRMPSGGGCGFTRSRSRWVSRCCPRDPSERFCRARRWLSSWPMNAAFGRSWRCSSWDAACYLGGRFGFLNRQIGSENVGRFFGSLGTMSPLYYVKPVLLNSAPLSLLVPIAVAAALWPNRVRSLPGHAEKTGHATRLFAIFWIVSIVFFNLAAYKRRNYLLPLWPPSAILIAWLVLTVADRRRGRIVRWTYVAVCAGCAIFNLVYLPHREIRECADSSYRPAAEEILGVVGSGEPLYTYGFDEELAPLLFYLDRSAPAIRDRLGDAPPGYVIVPLKVWK